MIEFQVEFPGHDDSAISILVVQRYLLLCRSQIIDDRQNRAAAVGKRSDGVYGIISLGEVLVGVDAVVSVIFIQDEMKSFFVIAGLVFVPVLACRLELRHQHLVHALRVSGR